MKRKIVTYLLTCMLAVGVIGINSAFAEKEPNQKIPLEVDNQHHRGKMNKEMLQKYAKELGIETEGKTTKELAKEVQEVKIIEKAKELGIKTDNKEMKDIADEIKETLILNKAKELNINTEGKSLNTLRKEVFEKSITNAAQELGVETEGKEIKEIAKEVIDKKTLLSAEKLGIDTNNKTTKELMEEILTNYKVEAKKQKLFPYDEEFDFHFMRKSE